MCIAARGTPFYAGNGKWNGLEVLGTTWLTLGTWHFIFLAPLGTQLDFTLFLFCRFCKIIFSQDGGIHV